MTRLPYQRHGDVLVLRAAALPLKARPTEWPAFNSADACRHWLARIWADDTLVTPLCAASPRLAGYVERILSGEDVPAKRICRAASSVAGYLLRATGRSTPFGLFAGVALAGVGPAAASVGTAHRPLARPDTLWVDHVRTDLQARNDVLPHLTIGVSALAFRRGDTINVSRSGGRIASARISRPVSVLLEAAEARARGDEIMRRLTATGGTLEQARHLLRQALADGYLTSNLTAPMTVTDPAGHILRTLGPHTDVLEPATQAVLTHLREAAQLLTTHNRAESGDVHKLRETADDLMRFAAAESRSRISLDLRVDADVRVPARVLDEALHAAHALVRLTRTHGRAPAWATYATNFWERYGAGVLVPVRDAVDLAAGIGFPADYPMSLWSQTPPTVLPRDEKLAAKAMHAAATGSLEVQLTDADIDDLADDGPAAPVAPHVEIGFRIRSTSPSAVDLGDFLIDVRPAWTAGTLSGRFAAILGDRLSDQYATLPTMTEGALPAQLSFTPDFPHGENVARIPALLPNVLSIGEHREPADNVIGLDDLAVLSTGRHLHLVSVSRRRVIEPVVLHPLALEKQAPPIARFLAMIGRGFATAWTAFDWGPAAVPLPFLPRIRYRRAILSPARWKLPAAALPTGPFTTQWHTALTDWADTWRCPPRLELRDDDRSVSVDLAEPLHARLIHQYLQRHDHAVLAETVTDKELEWIGHAHEITMPLVSTGPQMPHPDLSQAPIVTNRDLPRPGDAGQRWMQVKVFTHPTTMDQILTRRLPALLEDLDTSDTWFVRYQSLHETDHLRIRLPAGEGAVRTLAAWAENLTADRLASHLVIDGYRPETGRYGTGPAMAAAEAVFIADSLVARYALTDVPALATEVRCALSMIDLTEGFLGTHQAWTWMSTTPAPRSEGRPDITRPTVHQVRAHPLLTASPRLATALAQRRAALGAYRARVNDQRTEQVLESLLHMLHNRMLGPDRASEAAARHAARQACRSLIAQGAA
ncbi:lantibiotic dehydratase [Streptomyces sp. CL12-4]|uniref:lantibiotic dehydratase n=1 Tax=Streptomyces sp. CL12-4 TaxID=2810306 RepID=UPI001EFC12B3|nr:lantibiotic dehydratase [Streptomyces sp. CL12-4]MCG8971766.1 lantibiotic dehydratase [Streptomyces sp. CL12-4]